MIREEPYRDMEEMLRKDEIAATFGIQLERCERGNCALTMRVRKGMMNAYGATHGTAIYALVDCAFALAGNSWGEKTVALSVSIDYRRPVKEGETLRAEATEESRGRTTALYRIRVTTEDGKLVAVANGLGYIYR